MNASARKGIIVGLLSAQVLAGQAYAGARPDPATAGHRPAPGFSEKDIFGKRTIALQSYRGKVVILNFWATWCSPCLEEVPALAALHASHQGQVAVIGASVFSSDDATEKFVKEHGIRYPVFYGSYDLMEKYDRVAMMPTTFIIDKHGEIAVRVIGARTREQYEDLIRPLLDH
jgi:thiol-disulfide isomerase/thioredoxin